MNKGINISNGEIVGIINSDDWYEHNTVELIIKMYNKFPNKKIFHGDRYDILFDGTKILRKFQPSEFKFIYYAMTYNHPSMFIHRDIYKDNLYNTNLRSLSDYEFVLRQFLKDKNLFQYIPIAYVNYRLDGISSQIKLKRKIKEGFIARDNSGLSFVKNCFSSLIRFTIHILNIK